MNKAKDITGQKFNRLTVIKRDDNYIRKNGKTEAVWLCQCECGNFVKVRGSRLRNGVTKSCGCLLKEKLRKNNEYVINDNVVEMYASNNELFYIDLDDLEKVKKITWCSNGNGYFVGTIKNKKIYLHRYIMDCPDGMDVDHKNHNKFDNRKSNLRIVNRSQNMMNKSKRSDNTSGVTGVRFNKDINKWTATINENKKYHYLGSFDNIEDAIQARIDAEKKYFGEYRYEFANLVDNHYRIGESE